MVRRAEFKTWRPRRRLILRCRRSRWPMSVMHRTLSALDRIRIRRRAPGGPGAAKARHYRDGRLEIFRRSADSHRSWDWRWARRSFSETNGIADCNLTWITAKTAV